MTNTNSLLSIGAMIFLSLISIRFNTTILENTTVETENKVYLTAFSLADDLIEEIKQKAFDAATVKFPTTNPEDLTAPTNLGHGWWETYPNYNDIDDYNGFIKTVSAPHAENYVVKCSVWYVNGDNPDQRMTVQTFYKKVQVTVTSPYMRNPIKLSFIFTLK